MSKHPLARYGKVMGVSLAAGGVAGVVSAVASGDSWINAAIIAGSVSVAMGVALWASLVWWRGLDEAAQEAHKWAWWWGSTIGLAVAGVLFTTLLFGMGPQGEASVKSALMLGGMAVVSCQAVGYGVAWAFWWLKRR